MTNPPLEIVLIFILFGSLVGSFLNVIIYRVPKNLSVVTPRSKCPKCSHKISWYENIPVISFLFLKGKCKKCKTKIPTEYVLVEILMGIFAYLLIPQYIHLNSMIEFIFYFSTASVFVCHFIIDVKYQILPDKINLYFLVTTIIYSLLFRDMVQVLMGGAVGFLLPYGVTYLFYKIRGVVGLGGGDIKLFGILGLILGPIGIVQNMFFSCAIGAICGLILILMKKMKSENPLAFGPFIILGATLQIYLPNIFKLVNPFLI